jgi:hypothetical protein
MSRCATDSRIITRDPARAAVDASWTVRGGRCALRGRLLGVIRVLAIRVPGGPAAGGSSGRTPSSAMSKPETTSTVRHWGSFFGGTPGNVDIEKSPSP